MGIKCLVVDDKPLAIDILVDYVRKTPFLELAATATNPIEGLSIIRNQTIDLIFLDIQMPELTGLQFMSIAGRQCKVILVTAYAEFALDGFENDVVDYLLKPVSFDRFYRAAEKVALALNVKNEDKAERYTTDYIFIKSAHRLQKIDLKDILFIEGLQNYIAVHTRSEKILSLQPLKNMESELSSSKFVRVHKSYIVAVGQISSIERSRIFIGDAVIPIGDSYRDAFFKIIGNPTDK
nr:LytTR family DNA-binding domain-containing protein [uncultured Mucilaginibacter sp.]